MKPPQEPFGLPLLVAEGLGIDDDQEGVTLIRLQKTLLKRVGQNDEVTGAFKVPAKRSQEGLIRADGQNLAHGGVAAPRVPNRKTFRSLRFGTIVCSGDRVKMPTAGTPWVK